MIFTPVYKLGPLSVELFCYIYVIGRHMLCEDCGYVTYSVAGDGTQHKQMHTVSPTVLYWLCPTPPPPPDKCTVTFALVYKHSFTTFSPKIPGDKYSAVLPF